MKGQPLLQAVGLARSAYLTISKNAPTLKAAAENVTPSSAMWITKARDLVMDNMENLLQLWIEDQTPCQVPLSTNIISAKALSLSGTMRKDLGIERIAGTAENFKASAQRYDCFKSCGNLHWSETCDAH